MRNPEVDQYIENAAEFAQPVLHYLRDLIHTTIPDISEGLKWSSPFFTYKGANLFAIAAFKQHLAFRFWSGTLMDDPDGILNEIGKSTMMGLENFSSREELPSEEVLQKYLLHALDIAKSGKKAPKKASKSIPAPDLPEDFADALAGNSAAQATYDGFSNSNKKDYVEWVTGAKTEATRNKRIATAVEWMAEGKVRNWKYIKKK